MMGGYGYSRGIGMMGGYSPLMGFFGFLFWLLILVAVGVLLIWVLRRSGHDSHVRLPMSGPTPGPQQQHDEAMAIARKRLASGEITREQFEDICQALGG